MNLSGKVAVVTGSATGVGQGIALRLAECGAKVVVTHNRTPADATMKLIQDAGGTAVDAACDVTSAADVENLMETARAVFGGLDILVNNAAAQLNKWLLEYTEREYDHLFNVNLMGYARCIRAAVPLLRESPAGRVINISSIHAKRPTGFDSVYGMTKAAIIMLTREAAIELSPYGITVNAICPGAIEVESKASGLLFRPNKAVESRPMPYGRYLSGRVGIPADVGYMAAFLASDESRYITGSALRMDGGGMLAPS